MRVTGVAVIVLATALAACPQAMAPNAGGPGRDAGMPSADASVLTDAGPEIDAGISDAGSAADSGPPSDAGTPLDAGAVDAGSAVDGGEPCNTNSNCEIDEYCAGDGCDTPGHCAPRPHTCPTDCADPGVCGCDEQLFCNACVAESMGVRPAPLSMCMGGGPDAGPVGVDGGCTDDSQCSTRDYCAGTGCGTPGTCERRPETCPLSCTLAGVCGCDGRGYCNDCYAEQAGTRVASKSGCSSGPDGGASCSELTSEGLALIQATQSCTNGSDCVVDTLPCGLDSCWSAMNTTNSAALEPILQEFTAKDCGHGLICGCPPPPGSVACTGGVCVTQ